MAGGGDGTGKDGTIHDALEHAAGQLEKAFQDEPAVKAAVHSALGTTFRNLGEFEPAEAHLRAALSICEDHLGPEHPDTGRALLELAGLHFFRDDLKDAQPLAARAQKILRDQDPLDHSRLASTLNVLGLIARAQGRHEDALAHLQESLEHHRAAPQTHGEHILMATTLESLAGVHLGLGQYFAAEPLMREVLQVRQEGENDETSGVATALYNLAVVLHFEGKYAEAVPLFRRCEEIEKKVFGGHTPVVAITTYRQGRALAALARYEEAETLIRLAARIHREGGDGYRRRLANDLTTLAWVQLGTARPGEALETAREAETLLRAARGDEHPRLPLTQAPQAAALEQLGELEEAERIYRKVVTASQEGLGEEHPQLARARLALAGFLTRRGRSEEAESLSLQGMESLQAGVGEKHPWYAGALTVRAEVLEALGRGEEAE